MRQLIFKIFLGVLFLATCNSIDAKSNLVGKETYNKVIKKEFPISSNGNVEINNKYGKIDVKSWTKNVVKIEITIEVQAYNQAAAQKVMDNIDVDFLNGDDYVNAKTEITNSNNNCGSWNNKSDFTINYEVYMPASCFLNLSNEYGNSYIAELDADANIDVMYGDVSMDGVNGDVTLKIEYGNGSLVNCNSLNLDIQYGKVSTREAVDVLVDSQFSKIYIDKAENIKCDSKYDDYFIGTTKAFKNDGKYDDIEIENVEKINVETMYSNITIENLKRSAEFDLKYSEVNIREVQDNFSEIIIESNFSNVKITMGEKTPFEVDAKTSYASISYPTNLVVTYEKDTGLSHTVKGHRGEQIVGVIKANMSYGGLRLR